jgi:curved DNA-binding protein CbpA
MWALRPPRRLLPPAAPGLLAASRRRASGAAEAARAPAASHYDTLGLSPKASTKEVKSQYKKLSLRWHPDRNVDSAGAAAQFVRISEAYTVLCDEAKRRAYDRSIGVGAPAADSTPAAAYRSPAHSHQQPAGGRAAAAGASRFHPGAHGRYDHDTHYREHYGRSLKERQQAERENAQFHRNYRSNFWPVLLLLLGAVSLARLASSYVKPSRTSR